MELESDLDFGEPFYNEYTTPAPPTEGIINNKYVILKNL